MFNYAQQYYGVERMYPGQGQAVGGAAASGTIDGARQELERAESTLQGEVDRATRNIAELRSRKAFAASYLEAAKTRLAHVRGLSETLCDGCWSVLPAIGHQLERSRTLREGENVCIWCGVDMSLDSLLGPSSAGHSGREGHLGVGLPPLQMSALQSSQAARENVESFLQGHPPAQMGGGCNDLAEAKWTSTPLVDPALELNLLADREHTKNCNVLTKQQAINLQTAEVRRLMKSLGQINHAIEQWGKYKAQHEEEKEKLNTVKARADQHEREHLEERLAQLNGVPPTAASQENTCSICLERPKQIAFACGHRCCHTCSQRLDSCHNCRAPIVQRIRLFE